MVVLGIIFITPPVLKRFNSSEIHGFTDRQVFESAKDVRHNMATEQRHAFDVAFGLIKQFQGGEGDNNAFAKTVSGKSADEIVDLARKEVEAKIAAGDPEFKNFKSWDDMLSKEVALDAPKKAASQPPAPLRQSERTGRSTN